MIKAIRLSPRLEAVVSFVPNRAKAADVGTDHGYIAVRLAQDGAESVIASDVNRGPLAAAMSNACEYEVADKITFVLSDGLKHLEADFADTVIIAGMGGETIAEIMAAADWTRNGGHRFILQPMSKLKELSAWLYKNGFSVSDARLALDSGTVYVVLLAEAKPESMPDPVYLSVPKPLLYRSGPLLPQYLDGLILRIKKVLCGMELADLPPERKGLLEAELESLLRIRKGLNNADSK